MAAFARRKAQRLARADPSRKRALDARAAELARLLNARERFCTTSSCDGRVTVTDTDPEVTGIQKKNCTWLLVTHDPCVKDDVMTALKKATGDVVFKFEPFVLHVLCRELQDAQLLYDCREQCVLCWACFGISAEELRAHVECSCTRRCQRVCEVPAHWDKIVQCLERPDIPSALMDSIRIHRGPLKTTRRLWHSVAIDSGFRNSGITVGRGGKITMAVRSTHCLEVPLSHKGRLMVSEEYIEFLVHVANQKMEENIRRIDRFHKGLELALEAAVPADTLFPEGPEKSHPVYVHRRKRRTAQEQADPSRELEPQDDTESSLGLFAEIMI